MCGSRSDWEILYIPRYASKSSSDAVTTDMTPLASVDSVVVSGATKPGSNSLLLFLNVSSVHSYNRGGQP